MISLDISGLYLGLQLAPFFCEQFLLMLVLTFYAHWKKECAFMSWRTEIYSFSPGIYDISWEDTLIVSDSKCTKCKKNKSCSITLIWRKTTQKAEISLAWAFICAFWRIQYRCIPLYYIILYSYTHVSVMSCFWNMAIPIIFVYFQYMANSCHVSSIFYPARVLTRPEALEGVARRAWSSTVGSWPHREVNMGKVKDDSCTKHITTTITY